jgi:hypothetical protein
MLFHIKQNLHIVRFEAFTAVTMKNVVFWDVALCRTWVNQRFGGTYRCSLQPAAHTCSRLADYSTLKMEAIHSSETSVYPSSTQRHIPEDNILQNLHIIQQPITQNSILGGESFSLSIPHSHVDITDSRRK